MKSGDIAPDFEAETTEGRLRFHEWLGANCAVLFSHPKDYTPVCTTELGEFARLKPEFDERNTKLIGLSVDKVGDHHGWAQDIKDVSGQDVNFPMIGDYDLNVSKLYNMLPAEETEAEGRTAAANATVRSEEHTSELQSLMRISYAVFCLKKKKQQNTTNTTTTATIQNT